jgi:GNAT superfamily N-acetyltransferase
LLRPISRDFILFDLMEWAKALHGVQLKLLARGEHVAICELLVAQRNRGHARRVMAELCSWADCARVTLELTPSNHWGSNVDRLTAFYVSLGFEENPEEPTLFRIQESMIRYPVRGRGHVRL